MSTQPDVEGSSYKIRDDLFVLGSEVLEDVSVNSIPHGTPFLKRLFLAVSFLLENKGIVLEKVESYQFCEHYHFRRGEARTVFLLHYNAEEVVTSVLPASKSGGDFEEEMRTILEAVSRKYIVLEETPSAMLAGRPEALLSCEYVYIVDAYTQLVKCARKDAIVLTEATVMSPHHLHCAFTKGGHTAAVDYFFTARGRLTRAIPRQGVTTSAVLMQKILDYSTGTAAVV